MKHIIENDQIRAEISELGATLVRFIEKGSGKDIVLGFDSDEEYLKNSGPNLGATIGRNANRIGNARFTLNGKEYRLTVNDNMNQLHGGGIEGFAFRMWETIEKKDDMVKLHYFSKDGEQGFPGNLSVTVTYRLDKDSLIFAFEGECDADTIFNITNHSYFNLGDPDIRDEKLRITTDRYSPTDEYSLTLDETRDVKDTPYDFCETRRIGDSLERLSTGIDNNYVWENTDDKLMCELSNDSLSLKVYSDLPDMHVYTGYYLNGEEGKYGQVYVPYKGIALECQYYPNGINYGDRYLLPVLKKGQKMSHYIRYEIDGIGKE